MTVLKYFNPTSSAWEEVAETGPQGSPGADGPAGPPGPSSVEEDLFVLDAGDTMTGSLVLPADPTAALEAATKQYADTGGQPESSMWGVFVQGDALTGAYAYPQLTPSAGRGLGLGDYNGQPAILLKYTGFHFANFLTLWTDGAAIPLTQSSVWLNGSFVAAGNMISITPSDGFGVSAFFWANAGDYLQLAIWQNSGVTKTYRGLGQNFAVRFLGENF